MTAPQAAERRHVQVWFGKHVIADYTATPDLADRYAEAMDRRFAGLKVTNEPVPLPTSRPLPSERLWQLPPN